MEKYIYDEKNGLHYELVGDYYLPLLTVPEAPPIGIWGQRRQQYLKSIAQRSIQPCFSLKSFSLT